MKKQVLLSVILIGIVSILISNTKTKLNAKSEVKKAQISNLTLVQPLFTFSYHKYALTKFNIKDFSWKFLQEFNDTGEITLIGDEKKLIIGMPGKGKELFVITEIKKFESGFIATTDKNFMIIFSVDYNRIAMGEEGSDIFVMFIFYDADREKINNELIKMVY